MSVIAQGGITDDQLRDLFARHCQCRPLDLNRDEDDHSAVHDCDTGILRDIQVALGVVLFYDIQVMHEARARCAKMLLWKRNSHGGWTRPISDL